MLLEKEKTIGKYFQLRMKTHLVMFGSISCSWTVYTEKSDVSGFAIFVHAWKNILGNLLNIRNIYPEHTNKNKKNYKSTIWNNSFMLHLATKLVQKKFLKEQPQTDGAVPPRAATPGTRWVLSPPPHRATGSTEADLSQPLTAVCVFY